MGKVFRAFFYRDFALMWSGAFLSTTGTWMQMFAEGWLVYELTQSNLMLGTIATLNGLPILLFSLFAGVAADRIDRRKLLIGSQLVQMATAFALAGLILTDQIQIWHLLVAAFVSGTGQAFGGPAYQALIPSLVNKADLPNAIALLSTQFNLARVIGPLIGKWTFDALGAGFCFALNGCSFVFVIAVLLIIKTTFVPKKEQTHVLESLLEGMRYVWNNKALRSVVWLATLIAFLAVPLTTLLPSFADRSYGIGSDGYSLMLSISAVGAVIGALCIARLGNSQRKGPLLLVLQIALGVFTVGFALNTNVPVGLTLLFLNGAAVLGSFAMLNSLAQLVAPEELRGRIMSVYHFAFRGAMPLGNFVVAAIAEKIGAPIAIATTGVLIAVVSVLALAFNRELRSQ